jgi:hypothetical protein
MGASFAQPKDEPVGFFKTKNAVVFTDNTEGTYITIEFPGDSLSVFDGLLAFNVGYNFYQILRQDYDQERYPHKKDTLQELALLKHFETFESDYLAKEVYKQPLETNDFFFKNTEGKRFHLWYFPHPPKPVDDMPEGTPITPWHFYLSFMANEKVIVVYAPITNPSISFEEKLDSLKSIAETVDIFGGFIDKNALYYKLDAAITDELMELVDPLGKFYLSLPPWFNKTRSVGGDFITGTLADVNNQKDEISIKWFSKEEYKSLKDFQYEHILKYKSMDPMNGGTFLIRNKYKNKEENQGLSYKMQLMIASSLLETHVVTYETSSGYLLCSLMATPESYDRNLPKFLELLNGIVLE